MFEFYTNLLQGIDLERFDFLVPTLCGFTIVLCVSITFRALLGVFNTFFKQ